MVGWLGYHYFMSHSEPWSISAQHQNLQIQAALCLISWSTCAKGRHGPHNQQSLGILKLGSSLVTCERSEHPTSTIFYPNSSKRLDSPLQKQGLPEFQTPIPSIFPFSHFPIFHESFEVYPPTWFQSYPQPAGQIVASAGRPSGRSAVDLPWSSNLRIKHLKKMPFCTFPIKTNPIGLAKFQIGSKTF